MSRIILDKKILDKIGEDNLEVEIRFGNFYNSNEKSHFNSSISWSKYQNIEKYLSAGNSKTTKKVYTTENKNDIRKITTFDGKINWQEKRTIFTSKNKTYNFALDINKENDTNSLSDFVPDIIRHINRTTYRLDENIDIDLSIVENEIRLDNTNENENNIKRKTSYEVEIEYKNYKNLNLKHFELVTEKIYMLINDTEIFYNPIAKNVLFETINKICTGNKELKKDKIENGIVTQLRNFKFEDMVSGGVINNKVRYRVGFKTDGLRKLLVINELGLWLVYGNEVNHIFSIINNDQKTAIIDGEYIYINNKQKYFWIFDCLAVNNENITETKSHELRISKAIEVFMEINLQQPNVLKLYKDNENTKTTFEFCKNNVAKLNIGIKTFYELSGVNGFYNTMINIIKLSKYNVASHINDGFVIVPENTIYNTRNIGINLKDRILSQYPDICKIKPLEKITIDFAIFYNEDETVTPYVSDLDNSFIPFTGSFFNDFNNKIEAPQIDVPDGTVIEYKWDSKNEIFLIDRIRHDKLYPNILRTAQSNWDMIHDPISDNILRGYDFMRIVRKYHNRIKKELFVTNKSNNSEEFTLLDIGSGRGGDVGRWSNFTHVFAVEPNKENIKELKNRVNKYDLNKKVTIIEAAGQDSQKITRERESVTTNKVDVISFMLSLSFFWQSKETLVNLVKTIKKNLKPGGKIIFLTIDGTILDEYFDNTSEIIFGGYDEPDNEVVLPVIIKYDKNQIIAKDQGKIVNISIPDTIVSKGSNFQTEYPVYIEDLAILLSSNIDNLTRANKEDFLPDIGKKFTALYSYGSITYKTDTTNRNILSYDRKEDTKNNFITLADSDKKYTVISIPQDNHNLFHAICYSLIPEYKNSSNIEKIKMAQQLRSDIADTMLDSTTWHTSGSGTYDKLAAENEDFNIPHTYNQMNSDAVIGLEHYFYIAEIVGCNFKIISNDRKLDIVNDGVDKYIILYSFYNADIKNEEIIYYSLLQDSQKNVIF